MNKELEKSKWHKKYIDDQLDVWLLVLSFCYGGLITKLNLNWTTNFIISFLCMTILIILLNMWKWSIK